MDRESFVRPPEQVVRNHYKQKELSDAPLCPESSSGCSGTSTYVLNILPKRLPKVVVPNEPLVLRDLPFYKEAREADAKAHQERFE